MTGAQHKLVGIGFGIASAYYYCHTQSDPYGVLLLPMSAVGCMLPDIDHDMTQIGRKRKFLTDLSTKAANMVVIGGIVGALVLAVAMLLGFNKYGLSLTGLVGVILGLGVIAILRTVVTKSDVFKWATKHRGIMHTLVVPVILILAIRISDFPLWSYSMLGLAIGYCSHLFADMLTVEGCPVLFPITRKNIRFLKLRTKNKSCTIAAWIVAIVVVGISIVLF